MNPRNPAVVTAANVAIRSMRWVDVMAVIILHMVGGAADDDGCLLKGEQNMQLFRTDIMYCFLSLSCDSWMSAGVVNGLHLKCNGASLAGSNPVSSDPLFNFLHHVWRCILMLYCMISSNISSN